MNTKHITLFSYLCFSLLSSSTSLASYEDESVIIPRLYGSQERYSFPAKLLSLALERSETLETSPTLIKYFDAHTEALIGSNRRSIMLINGTLDVLWSAPKPELEENALRINVPLNRGLFGYRISFISEENSSKLKAVQTLSGLRKLTAGLGDGWTDTIIFQENSLPVITGPGHASLLRMLSAKRFDYFPRGIAEILPELEMNKPQLPSLSIETSVIIYYYFPVFLYVSPEKKALHDRLSQSLTELVEDGTYHEEWLKSHSALFSTLDLSKSIIIELSSSNQLPKTSWREDLMLKPLEFSTLAETYGKAQP